MTDEQSKSVKAWENAANNDAVLTNLGEKMSDDEVDELLKAVDTSSGEINYTGMFHLSVWVEGSTNSLRSRPHHPRQLIPLTCL